MKNKESIKFFSLKRLDATGCKYRIAFGERSNGKTYAVLNKIIVNYVNNNKQGAYIRRWEDDLKGKRGSNLFASHVRNGVISKLTHGMWTDVIYRSFCWYFARKGDSGDIVIDDKPFCFGFALTTMEHDKGTAYPDVTIIFFDEFLTRRTYLPDEFVYFMNTLSTIIRYRTDVVVYMMGNTVNKYCPYFAEMGLKHASKMMQGDLEVYKYGNSELSVAIEYASGVSEDGKPSDVYFAFDNPKLQMITGGVWEMAIYPHCPHKYSKSDIVALAFIVFDGDTLQCEVVRCDNEEFMFIHRKSTDIQDEKRDIIYSPKIMPYPNWRRRVTQPQTKFDKKFYSIFQREKVFYQDNEVGEIVRNYLQWCRTERNV